ncbi:family 43 glycosylhydrolase, partial [Paenibacillus vortex]|uniref:family 43 glycosylhydrolase n=1 Tax=Paenibacillus vortex TaxID=71995 RepID=UPI003AF2B410
LRLMQNAHIKNPLIEQRADPWIYKHVDGYYYFTGSVPEYDRIVLRRSTTIQGLVDSQEATIWRKHESGLMSANIWAPELHYIDGKWYVYYAAAHTSETRDGLFDHRMFVLENEAANPLDGEWVEKGQVITRWESFALDATTFEHRGNRYYVWAQKDPAIPGNSNLVHFIDGKRMDADRRAGLYIDSRVRMGEDRISRKRGGRCA